MLLTLESQGWRYWKWKAMSLAVKTNYKDPINGWIENTHYAVRLLRN